MAVAVDFRTFTPPNSREDLIRRIEAAPQEHAQAVLEAYDLLENLHSKGILAALNGVLGSSDAVINHVVGLVSSKEAVTAARVGLMLLNVLSKVDADRLHRILTESSGEPLSLLGIARLAKTTEARTAIGTGLELLSVFGAALNAEQQKKS